jgi:hypothetical protein
MGRGTTYCGRGVSIAVTSFASFTCAAAARPVAVAYSLRTSGRGVSTGSGPS